MPVNIKFETLTLKLSVFKKYYFIVVQFLISSRETITEHPVYVFIQNLHFPKRLFSRRNPIIKYFYKLIGTMIEAALLVSAAGLLSLFVYYTLGLLWYVYLDTPMGDKFISLHPEMAETIFALSELDLLYFCAEVTLTAFVICFALSALCRFLHISHYLYLSLKLFGRLAFWGIPFTGAVSYYIKTEYGLNNWEITAFIVMIPTYLMFISCFRYSQKLIPEAGDVLKISIAWARHSYQIIHVKISDLIRHLMNQ